MQVKKKKTVRFGQLIGESGRPSQVILWTTPDKDPSFSRAIKEQRVLTIFQRNVGAQRDFGMIGFFEEKSAAFFVFPKRLCHPPETKVVGIKYDAIAASKPGGPIFKPASIRKPGIPMKQSPRRSEDRAEKKMDDRTTTHAQIKAVKEPAKFEF